MAGFDTLCEVPENSQQWEQQPPLACELSYGSLANQHAALTGTGESEGHRRQGPCSTHVPGPHLRSPVGTDTQQSGLPPPRRDPQVRKELSAFAG